MAFHYVCNYFSILLITFCKGVKWQNLPDNNTFKEGQHQAATVQLPITFELLFLMVDDVPQNIYLKTNSFYLTRKETHRTGRSALIDKMILENCNKKKTNNNNNLNLNIAWIDYKHRFDSLLHDA